MTKTKNEELFTTLRVLRKSVDKLQDINNQEIEEKKESVPQWKTFDNIINEKHKKAIKTA